MLEQAINWMYDKVGKVFYSMGSRRGPNSYDCSSSVYFALINAGRLPSGTPIGNTDSLFRDLEMNGWTRLAEDARGYIDTKRGDVFIWGVRGASSGAFGHTGIFVDANNIIHCSSGYNGMHVDNHDWLYRLNGSPANTIYRYTGSPAPAIPSEVGNPHDQSVDIGSWIKFTGTFIVNDVQLIGGIWQIRSDVLCPRGFTWEENGIPAEPVYEVDSEGYATVDQNLDPGALYKIPGKYKVLDLGLVDNMWLALIEWNGLKFWVDLASATEIPSTDRGTPVPVVRPAPQPIPPSPEPPAPEVPKQPEPAPQIPEPQPEPPKVEIPPVPQPPVNNPNESNKKEDDMAFTKEEQKQLKSATQSAQEFADDITASEGMQELVQGISKKTKLFVYFVGDTLVGLGLIVPMLAIVLGWGDMQRIVALSGIFSTSGGFLLMMFGIYKGSKKS